MDVTALIDGGLGELGLTGRVPPDAPRLLDRYTALLLEQNRVMNLTAITDPAEAASLHMLDSAALLNCPGVEWSGRLLDVGSGAGLPGVALKLLLPALDVTLLDSQQKRVDWLDGLCGQLSPTGVRAVHARAEEAAHLPQYREGFDLVTARAVAELRVLAELCLPFVRVGGWFLAMKGPDPADECAQAEETAARMGGQVRELYSYSVPGAGAVHTVVRVRKVSPTPAEYPRRWAKIKKSSV